MNRLALSLLPFLGLGVVAACGSSTTTTSSTTSTTTSTGATGSTSSGTTSSSSTSSSSSSGAPTLDCTSYCTTVMASCTGQATGQYSDMIGCMHECADFTAVGTLADTMGDTLGCRIHYAVAAAGSTANATMNCPSAGPSGGDKDPKGTAGVCGEPCTAFCSIAQKICTGANQQFADMPTCMTACGSFTASKAEYSIADVATNDLGCRFYHLGAASENAANATMHCPHIVVASAVCTM